jgi:LmbE family N-acetylglucosaminyl deacetylase
MAIVYVLAHFDDEYCALPLIRQRAAEGLDQRFLYVAGYADPQLARVRHAESRALLAHLGIDPAKVVHVGSDTGVMDGSLHRGLATAFAALGAAVGSIGAVERFACTAWEGGHMDHDMCALMTTILARDRGGVPIDQISLYNGKGLAGPFFHGGWPLPENGPVTRLALTAAGWARWMGEVRFFPSQTKTWLGLWPAMFWTYAAKGGFGYQRLDPARIERRPHEGSLFYERMFKTPYAEVRAAADAFRAQARA